MKTSCCLLGVDIGTYSSKGALVTAEGELIASRSVEHALSLPGPGYVEHDPEAVWWHDFKVICRSLLEASGIDPARIGGIGISTISPAVVAVDEYDRALRPAILYGVDTRATREIEELREKTGLEFTSQSGMPKILWIRRHEPEVWAKTRRIVNGSGYLNLKLCGQAAIDVYDASGFLPLYDPGTHQWSDRFADVAPPEMLPKIAWTCEIAGRVTPEAARETGLSPGTPIITGTADAASEAISAGLSEVGDMMVMYGSSTFFIVKTARPYVPGRFWGADFLEKDTYVLAGGTATAGSLTKWFRDRFAPEEVRAEAEGGPNAYAALSEEAAGSPPGARGLVALPYFSGERTPLHDPDAKGMIFGLNLLHTRADIYRALLESVGYAVRHNIEVMREEGVAIERILAVGGGAQNPLWMRIVSDIAQIEQHIPAQQIGASYGDAFLAGVGIGLFDGSRDASRWVRMKETVRPRPDAAGRYDASYHLYRDLYERNKDLMRRAGELRTGILLGRATHRVAP